MKLEIMYFPPEKVITAPSLEATYPFEIFGKFKYIVDFSFYLERDIFEEYEELFCSWMNNVDYYPIYSLAEISDDQQEEYEELLKSENMDFDFLKRSSKNTIFLKVVISTPHQFNRYFPYLYENGSVLNLSLWSIKQDVFRLEEREFEGPSLIKRSKRKRTTFIKPKWNANVPIITLTEGSTVFWVGHDGDFITAFSSNEEFSTPERLQKIISKNIEVVVGEYGWE